MKKLSRIPVVLAVMGAASPAIGADVENGLKISKQWCAACHVVAPDQTSASVDVPTFGDIARRKTEKKPLAAFLAEPHGKMPNMSLTRNEIDDIVAYIRSLGPAGAEPEPPRKLPERPRNG
ncbi:MAG: c-type cytochrome [Rhodoblastus sp.]